MKAFIGFVLCAVILASSTFAKPTTLNREEIPDMYKWNFTDIYPNWDAWEADMKIAQQKMDEYITYKGKLSEGPDTLLKLFRLGEEIGMTMSKVFSYVSLQATVNGKDRFLQAQRQKPSFMYNKFSTDTSWYRPELLKIPQETMHQWIRQKPELKVYEKQLNDMYFAEKHVLSEDKETLLTYFSTPLGTASAVYRQLTNADIQRPEITLSTGEKVVLTQGNYSRIMRDEALTQEDRKNAYIAYLTVYKDKLNTFATIYSGVCHRNWANARARNYPSSLEARLYGNKIPLEVYENLVTTVRNTTAPLKRYMKLKKDVIMKRKNLKEYWSYDGSLSLTDFNKDYPYEAAKDHVFHSVAPLGKEYQNNLRIALDNRWIDVYENDGKDSGAFSSGVYGIHPFIKMNYNDTIGSMFTLAHELGHAMHSVYSNRYQPYATSGYTIFVAEVASTFNEHLLVDHLLSKTKDPRERVAILREAIGNITGTFIFQTYLADFELQVHRLAEQGKPITADVLIAIEKKLNEDYYGDSSLRLEEFEGISWSMIPHLYGSAFYVYQYATSYAASAKLYKDMTTGSSASREAARKRYIELLSSGGNDYPIEQLKKAGVDMSNPDAVNAVSKELDRLVTLLEKELKRIK